MPIFQVDAFASRPFEGNPAAVCLPGNARNADWMQAVAAETNLSDTAFLWPEGDGFRLRWFTPKVEVQLCGHATLASAHVLYETEALAPGDEARFETRSGALRATRTGHGIEIDLPALPGQPGELPEPLRIALGVAPVRVNAIETQGHTDFLIELASEQAVRAVEPDFGPLRVPDGPGFIVTARGSGDFDIVSRFFGPALGIDEDPVTGFAHCCLAPYWSERLGKKTLRAFQASQRGGVIGIRLDGERVHLAGEAVTVSRGRFLG